jgi:hypothetical protein
MDTSKAAAALGRLGGKAGRGESQRRGDSDYYRALVSRRKDRGCSRCHRPIDPGRGFVLYREAGGRESGGVEYGVHELCIAEDVAAGLLRRVGAFAYEPVR